MTNNDNFDASMFRGGFDLKDSHNILVQALIQSNVQFTQGALDELIFIALWGEEEGLRFIEWLVMMKQHQSPGAMKRFVDALKAQSLYEEKTRRQNVSGEK